ncbi:MAG: hypothetical protein Q8936_06000 [Bacillota bacterium]|nr:hypothetical protein [Bacillota bacterium]
MSIKSVTIHVDYRLDSARLIIPTKIYLRDEEGLTIYNVHRIIRRDNERIDGVLVTTFTCEIEGEDIKQLCDVRYMQDSKEWRLLRI